MHTLELIDRLAQIFLDIILPIVVLWLATMIRQWLPKEAGAHQQIAQLQKNIEATLKPPAP